MTAAPPPRGPPGPAGAEPVLRTAMGLAGLGALVYGVVEDAHPGLAGRHLVALVLAVTTGLGWAGWLLSRHGGRLSLVVTAVVVLALSGGAMVPLTSFGAVVVGVACLCAATVLELPVAAGLAGTGVAAAAVAVSVGGPGAGGLLAPALGALVGLVVGTGRRQQQDRVRRDAELAVAHQRSEVEHDRAELLAERTRIAREVHDVLAHTLSALSVQLTALDSLVEEGTDPDQLRTAIGRSRHLVVEGLVETRRAVRALRDEPVALADQLAALADADGARFTLCGSARPLPPAAGLALLRVAQEALTNARRHAPGAPVAVELHTAPGTSVLTVTNTTPSTGAGAPLGTPGGGHGLRGMRERVELLGGSLAAGPLVDGGWRVRAEVPV